MFCLLDKDMMAPEINKKDTPSNNFVARSAFKVALGSLLTLIAGFGLQVTIAYHFGPGAEMDAFLTALAVPLFLQAVLLTGLPFVLIPAFVQHEVEGREDEAWALAGTFFWLVAGILAVVAIGSSLFAQEIISLSAPGLNPGKSALTASMLSILMFTVPMNGLAILTVGIQNARHNFFWPAVAPAIGSLGNLMLLLVLYQRIGPMVLAWGYLAATALIASVTVVPVLRHGWKRLIPLNDSQMHEMARLTAPFIIFGVLGSCIPLLERYFASSLPDGELSYLDYAFRISGIVIALAGQGIAAAIFPAMAKAYVQDGEMGLVEKTDYALRLTFAVALPAFAILSAVAVLLVKVLFERGAFQHTATLSVSRILPIVMVGSVISLMVGNIIVRVFYVAKDTHTVQVVKAVRSLLYVMLAMVMVNVWGYVGLAFAQTVIVGVSILFLFLLLMRKLRDFHADKLLKDMLRYGAASLVAFIVAWMTSNALAFLPDLLQLLTACFVAGTLYMTVLFRIDRDIALSILELTGILSVGAKLGFHRIALPK